MSAAYLIPGAVPVSECIPLTMPEALQFLFEDYRYKVAWGGRDGCKSWSFAEALVAIAHDKKVRILCTREFQTSIKDSVHKLIKDTIERLGLTGWFEITDREIRGLARGSEFIFKGLHNNYLEIKSTEAVDICWVEEAQKVSHESWEVLIPTIRKPGSQIWVSFNPMEETDDTYFRFIPRCETCKRVFEDSDDAFVHHQKLPEHVMHLPPPRSKVVKTSYLDNAWSSKEMDEEREYLKRTDPEAYEHVYGGACIIMSEAVIFKGHYVVEYFETPVYPKPRFLFGLDFGFSDDMMALMRMFTTDNWGEITLPNGEKKKKVMSQDLWIDWECCGLHVELDHMEEKFDREMPEVRLWPIKADCSRPESITFLKRRGFRVSEAKKWNGSIEDGISYLKAFRTIHIHTRCIHMAQEARLYKWEVDKKQLDEKGKPVILPVPVDAHNHCWDANRYALDGYIKAGGGGDNVWARLGRK